MCYKDSPGSDVRSKVSTTTNVRLHFFRSERPNTDSALLSTPGPRSDTFGITPAETSRETLAVPMKFYVPDLCLRVALWRYLSAFGMASCMIVTGVVILSEYMSPLTIHMRYNIRSL